MKASGQIHNLYKTPRRRYRFGLYIADSAVYGQEVEAGNQLGVRATSYENATQLLGGVFHLDTNVVSSILGHWPPKIMNLDRITL